MGYPGRIRTITKRLFGALFGVIALIYLGLLLVRAGYEVSTGNQIVDTTMHGTILVFGATGTIGDGLLEALVSDPDIDKIHVVTRRSSSRIEQGVVSGKVSMTIHTDYQDYSAIQGILEEVDAVYWAIGLSAVGLNPEAYIEIHKTYPLRLLSEWLAASNKQNLLFHYVSGSGANLDSRMMWAREKARAEKELSKLAAQGSSLRVISYRPSFILPTDAEAHMGHRILHAVLAPIKSAVAAQSIGEAMLEVSAGAPGLPNGSILENIDIVSQSEAYRHRHSTN